MASTMALCLCSVIVALLLAVESEAGRAMVSVAPNLATRALQQAAPQCTCLKRDFKCASPTVWCVPGTTIPDVAAAGGCSVDDYVNTGCTGITGRALTCPNATAPIVERVCAPGWSLLPSGGPDSSCSVCQDITVIGSCDLDVDGTATANVGRTKVDNCPQTLTCNPGDIIDLTTLGCSATNALTARPGPMYWFNPENPLAALTAGVPLPTKIRCTDFLTVGSCIYHVGAYAPNGCTSETTFASITIGSGPVVNPDGDISVDCPAPY